MSYILDALKRADSERERGLVPGLHAQPFTNQTPSPGTLRAIRPLMLLIAGASLVLLCVMLWRWLGSDRVLVPVALSTVPVQPAMSLTVTIAPPVEAGRLVDKPVPPQSSTAALPSSPEATSPRRAPEAQLSRTVIAPAQITAAPSSVPQAAVNRKEPEASESRPQALANPAPSAQTTNPHTTQAAMPEAGARARPLAELPADIRLAIPKLVISGATYADNPTYRMLIINGQVFHEGEKVATDLLLEQIGPKTAVVNFKGQRYSLAY